MSFLSRAWKLFIGYVNVTVEGYFLEKFTNLCIINKIPFWNIKRYGTSKMVGRTTIKGFKKMRIEARKCGCRISLGKRRGTPFFLQKHKKRKVFAIGFFAFFIVLKVSGMFIWNIDINGNKTISQEKILLDLRELGLKPGVLRDKIDVRNLASLLIAKENGMIWAGIELNGIRANVRIVEKDEPPKKLAKDIPCDILSSKPALIVNMDTYEGRAMAKVGDVVDKGDILVEGVMQMEKFPEKTKFVHSLANIKGKVWYERTRGLKLSKLRSNEEVEKMAYKLAYKNILQQMPENSEILNISKDIKYADEKVFVTIIVENLENIGIERER